AVVDPHEIANACGADGVRYIADASRDLPLHVTVMAPSCVPATSMGTAGGALDAEDLARLRDDGIVHGLAEVMNFPGVVANDPTLARKIAAFAGRPIDGHCPGLTGRPLNAYIAAGVGSEHECVNPAEARQRLARGMIVLIREATNARNLDALLPIITPANHRRIALCTDDRTPGDLLRSGSIDMMLRRVIGAGVDPIDAIRLCTLNPAEWFRLPHLGAIAPGRFAQFIAFDDLTRPMPHLVFARGRLVARDGKLLPDAISPGAPVPASVLGRCRIALAADTFRIPARGDRVRVIGSLRDQLITEHRIEPAHIVDGHTAADPARDLLKIAVLERHGRSGNVGLGFITGIGLRRGAIAGTVAHDHHNLVCIGADDPSMHTACTAVADMGGGLCVAQGEHVIAKLPLPIAGLMSDRPIDEVATLYDELITAARGLGSPLDDPFMAMSFMALEVIPSLKLTDQGLVDVEQFRIVNLFV
ncbi:MAG TPA: adenine deaminase C-terminal domain-containing protein, partial [Tepidisphaeraceae bacterium]|nr:adenine deaminase C-terminal domain-containing protein [Tepidisphaeraceae bacterium]